MNDLTEQEINELESKFNVSNIISTSNIDYPILYQYSNGKVVRGFISENHQTLNISVSTFLCG